MFGKQKIKETFKTINEDYLNNHQIELNAIKELVNTRIREEKLKRSNTTLNMPEKLPNEVKIKEDKRRIQKIKKPLFTTQKIETYDPK